MLEIGDALLAEGAGDAQAIAVDRRCRRRRTSVKREERRPLAVLFECDGYRGEARVWRVGRDLERASLELATPPGDLQYWKYSYTHQYFYPYSRNLTFFLSGELDSGEGYGGQPLPFFKNYYSGGIGSVRGFRTASLGPRDIDGSFLGGNRKINVSTELLFPVPGSGLDRSMRFGAFVDGGQIYGLNDKFDLSQMRAAAGVSFAWNSPVGRSPRRKNLAPRWPSRARLSVSTATSSRTGCTSPTERSYKPGPS